jgi:hypothetical protein
MGLGIKYDQGKPDWYLLPLASVREIVKVLTIAHVVKGYAEYNWQLVEPRRYWSALFRHLDYYQEGEQYDKETGLSHLAHAGANILFLIWFELVKKVYLWRDADEVSVQVNEPAGESIKRGSVIPYERPDSVNNIPYIGDSCKIDPSFWNSIDFCNGGSSKTDTST